MMIFFKKAHFFGKKALILPTKSSLTKSPTRKRYLPLSGIAPSMR